MNPVAAAGLISGGAKLLGSLFGGKSPEERQAEAQKANWDANERARVQRCQNLTNWTKQYFASKGKSDLPALPGEGKDNCPPPAPYPGATQLQPNKLGTLFNSIGSGVAEYAASQYGPQGGSSGSFKAGTPGEVIGTPSQVIRRT